MNKDELEDYFLSFIETDIKVIFPSSEDIHCEIKDRIVDSESKKGFSHLDMFRLFKQTSPFYFNKYEVGISFLVSKEEYIASDIHTQLINDIAPNEFKCYYVPFNMLSKYKLTRPIEAAIKRIRLDYDNVTLVFGNRRNETMIMIEIGFIDTELLPKFQDEDEQTDYEIDYLNSLLD